MHNKQPLVPVLYTLADGHIIQIDVTPGVAAALQETDNKLLAIIKQDKRHLDFYGYTEGETESCASLQFEDAADLIERLDECGRLHHAIDRLTEPQRRRVKAYFFEDLSFVQIAAKESVDESAVRRSIAAGLKKLKLLL